ncbi:MAG: hypothetical protein Rhirs2KO_16960 [Rhizobiaceae bacterium]
MRRFFASERDDFGRLIAAGVAACLLLSATGPSFALSEIPEEDIEPPPEIFTVPLPPPIAGPGQASTNDDDTGDEDTEAVPMPAAELPVVHYDLELLPEPVRRMRELIVEACRAGDIEALRPLLGLDESRTQVSSGGGNFDPIDFLKDISGDGEGHEILAILMEVLEAGFVHLDPGEPEEIYLWPYFFALPLDGLSGPQRVELFKLVTAGDYEDMKSFGSYIFYRVGITPEGRWAFFLAGH